MPTSLAQGIRQAARDQEAARLERDRDATTGGPGEPPIPRRLLGNRPIRYKLWAILVVPMAAVLLFAALQIGQSTAEARSAEQVQGLAQLGVKVSALAHVLQQERGGAGNFLGTDGGGADDNTFITPTRTTDSAITAYKDEKSLLTGDQAAPIVDALNRVDNQLNNLTELRRSIVSRAVSQAAATFRYTTLITDLLDINEAIAGATDDRQVADQVRATAAFSRLKEFASQEQSILFEVLVQKSFKPGQYRDFSNSLSRQEASLDQFAASATSAQRALMDNTLTRALVKNAAALEAQAVRGETANDLKIEPRVWFNAMTQKINLLREVETQLGRDVVQVAGDLKDQALRKSLLNIGLVLLTLIIAVTISLMVARSMVRPLTKLRGSALEVANHSLPDLVRRLREDEEQPPDIAGLRAGSGHNSSEVSLIDPVEIHSNDEIGQVARAFNAVHLEAVRVATEQAVLRRSVSTMFVNLSRRSQLLVDRLIRLIDNLEQGEQDPDRLADLFKLDHLATRMRRNDENLLVLAGADAGRRWNQPASLVDVLRAATAEVEQYTRVRLGTVDESIEVAARAVNDMVHLVAELLENATSFSSPRTDVVIDARRVGDEAIIEIEDQGIGMAKEQMQELNDRLAKPPVFDVSVSRMMGLFVVGRLASRHSVKVQLRAAGGGGTMAVVALTSDVLTPRAGQPAISGPSGAVPQIVAQRAESDRMDSSIGLLESGRGDAVRGEIANSGAARADATRPELPEYTRPEPVTGNLSANMETTRLEPLVGSSGLKEESQRIPTIDSEIVQPGNLPAIPARPSSPAESAAQVRAVTPPPAIRPPLAPSATESATGQFVQLGPIDEPMHKPGLGISSAAAAMAVLRSSQPQSPAQPPAVPFDRPSPGPYSLSGPELLSGPSDPASMDPTIEMPLPIFEAIESEWFRSAPRPTPLLEPDPVIAPRPAAAASASVPFAPPQTATTPVERPAAGSGLPIRTPGQPVSPAPKQDAPAASFTPPPAAPAAPRPAPAPVPAEAPAADERQRVNPMSVSGRPVPATERPTDRPASVPPAAPVPGRDRDRERETVSSSPNGSSAKPPITVVPPVSAVPTASPAAAAPITPSGDAQRWSSPADAGWKAAQAAAEVQPDLATGSGLPKRVPMAHFVPGRVEPPKSKTPRSTVHRSPDAVRGVLSSYRHGLEQGRQATQAKHAVATEKNDEQEEM